MGGRQGVGSGQTHHPLPAPSRSQGTSCPCDELGESAEHPGGAQDLGREGREREGGQQISRHEAAAQMEGKRRLRRRPLSSSSSCACRPRCKLYRQMHSLGTCPAPILKKGTWQKQPSHCHTTAFGAGKAPITLSRRDGREWSCKCPWCS